MAMLTLPTEMLELIASFLDVAADLNALTRTHSRLYKAFNATLYSEDYPHKDDLGSPTALHWAAVHNRPGTVCRVLQYADSRLANAVDHKGKTALYMAADKGHVDVVALLLASDLIDVSIHGKCASHRWNAFHVACWKQRVGVIELMLQSGRFDPNAPCSTKSTPLGKAARDRQKKTVLALVASDLVDLYKESWGWTHFQAAMYREHPSIGDILLDAGFDPNWRNKDGSTALHMAAVHPTNLPLVKRLIATDGVDVNAVDNKGQTPLMIAASRDGRETPQVIKMLLKVPGIRKDVRRWDGKTVADMPCVRPEIRQLITGEKPKKPVKRWRLT